MYLVVIYYLENKLFYPKILVSKFSFMQVKYVPQNGIVNNALMRQKKLRFCIK